MNYLKVMDHASCDGYQFNIGTTNIWKPQAVSSEEHGGFKFFNEENILRWIIKGDTLYDVLIPNNAEIINVKNDITPNGIYRANKIIVKNPRLITDEVVMDLYRKSNMPEKAYYKTLAVLAIKGFENTCLKLIKDHVNKENIDLVLSEYEDFSRHLNGDKDNTVYDKILEMLKEIKSDLLISIVVDKKPYVKQLTDDKIINLTGQSGSGKSYYARHNFKTNDYLIVDTDDIFSDIRFKKSSGINKELGKMFRKKYSVLPDCTNHFDLIYQDIFDYCQDKRKIVVIDCAQFHCIKNVKLLKGKIIIMRTSINKCYERCLKRYQLTNPEYTLADLEKYKNRKMGLFKWYKGSNEFIKRIDKL
jgi:adenylate kinase family enzyme